MLTTDNLVEAIYKKQGEIMLINKKLKYIEQMLIKIVKITNETNFIQNLEYFTNNENILNTDEFVIAISSIIDIIDKDLNLRHNEKEQISIESSIKYCNEFFVRQFSFLHKIKSIDVHPTRHFIDIMIQTLQYKHVFCHNPEHVIHQMCQRCNMHVI
jgi:hypothetical protein